MSLDKDWDLIRSDGYNRVTEAGMGLLRITLLFGSAAIALALLIAPMLDRSSHDELAVREGFAGVDTMSTGSVGQRTYTIRKSVLQSSPDAVCVIGQNGRRSGDC